MEQLKRINNDGCIEIDKSEYLAMKNKLLALEEKINKIENATYRINSLKQMVNESPIESVMNAHDQVPIFKYSTLGNDTWNCFLTLGKLLHRENYKFYMDTCGSGPYRRPYIRSNGKETIPMVKNLDDNQKRISAEMLNELIPIYNKYYKMMHEQVLYRECGSDEFAYVDVLNNGKE